MILQVPQEEIEKATSHLDKPDFMDADTWSYAMNYGAIVQMMLVEKTIKLSFIYPEQNDSKTKLIKYDDLLSLLNDLKNDMQ